MPEASVLYSVTGVVVLGLVAWVGWVLTTQKEPWAREVLVPAGAAHPDVPLESPEENAMTSEGDPNTAEVVEGAKEKAEALRADGSTPAEPAEPAKTASADAERAERADAEAEAAEKAKRTLEG